MDIELNADELQIALTPEERELSERQWSYRSVITITFAITTKGNVRISEELSDTEERYGDCHDVIVPPRIWMEGLKWLESKALTERNRLGRLATRQQEPR